MQVKPRLYKFRFLRLNRNYRLAWKTIPLRMQHIVPSLHELTFLKSARLLRFTLTTYGIPSIPFILTPQIHASGPFGVTIPKIGLFVPSRQHKLELKHKIYRDAIDPEIQVLCEGRGPAL